jgi:hypothetical protein
MSNADLKKVAAREQKFSTLARTEGKGAMDRAKHSKGQNKADNLMEANLDERFAKKRKDLAQAARKKIK